MTKKITRLVFLIVCFVTIFAHYAVAGIVNSRHDFSSNATGTTSSNFKGVYYLNSTASGNKISEVCVFCHTPHGGSVEVDYQVDGVNSMLWNRVKTQQAAGFGYKLYTSSTFTALYSQAPTGLSLMCLSCHDGVTSIGVGSLLNAPGSGNTPVVTDGTWPTSIGDVYYWDNPTESLRAGPNIGGLGSGGFASGDIDLSNDHPVSFPWPSGYADIMKPDPATTGLRLFGPQERLECSTCHNVHSNDIPPFLAMSNANSAMCLKCHNK